MYEVISRNMRLRGHSNISHPLALFVLSTSEYNFVIGPTPPFPISVVLVLPVVAAALLPLRKLLFVPLSSDKEEGEAEEDENEG
ncbi:hypothetical protein ACLOJK_005508 [Asimina triloba]